MMNKQTFKELIAESAFKELFITELGWYNPTANFRLPEIVIDDVNYYFEQIARISSFQVLSCKVDCIPTSSISKKIDTQLRKQANDYICIYYVPNSEHHLWVVPVKKVEKRDLVLIEYDSAEKASFLFEKMGDLQFGEDEQPTIMDVKERVHAGFIINSEKITKDFYNGFRKEHASFAKYINGIDDEITDLKKNRNKQWYTSVMLNRLMFCYFIQKKGFLDLNINYLKDKLVWVQQEKGEDRFYDSFYRGFLLSLFHEGLNSPRHQPNFIQKYGRIPYLNGGMFGIHELEEKYPKLDIADEAFESLFAFFDQWHWHLDDRLTASGKDINPDVLGYIFEQYINDRAQMGAYYTKEDITEYIGRNTIVPFLMDATKKSDERPFKTNGEVWKFLQESGDTYIFDAVKKGKDEEIPEEIAVGIDTTKPNLLERRSRWNERTPDALALPTEIWRETIERLQRYKTIRSKIENGEITEINDFITYNLDIRQFVQDLLAKTEDHLFIKHFYAQLQKVTILDPTCGSGAFLFAALNILEPLYEVCIERMQTWNNENPNLFKPELEELYGRYRSNIRYFIYKNIILRNLYGVDIMVEATEIAKLRLFLKMVAVVDVNKREENLGLDPLPDIDFNIRCGNTLIGYATNADLEKDLIEGDMFANAEFKDKVHTEMDIVSRAYDTFRIVQLQQEADLETFRNAKKELKERLKTLNDLLNHKQYNSTVSSGSLQYDEWLKSHQPFNWLAEYYDIINGNNGFDVIIGNPPYVVYTDERSAYRIDYRYKTRDCANLYAFCIERSQVILGANGKFGMIVPNSSISANKMLPLQKIITQNSQAWISNYAWRPSKLFEGADMLLAIIIRNRYEGRLVHSTIYHKWYNEYRPCLFKCIKYTDASNVMIDGSIPKLPSDFVTSILSKMRGVSGNHILPELFRDNTSNILFYFRAVQYWFKILNKEPIFEEDGVHKTTGEMKPIAFDTLSDRNVAISILSSSTFFLNYIIWSSCQVVNSRDFNIPYNSSDMTSDLKKELSSLGIQLQDDYQKHSHIKERNYSKKGRVFTMQKQHFFIKHSKSIIDKIDNYLAKYYGFTEEELDYIINYDIKYRMGDELNEE